MRLAVTAGGTGGHIFPALAVVDGLRARDGLDLDVRFFGPDDRGERELVAPSGIEFVTIPSAGVRGRGPIALVRAGIKLCQGVFSAVRGLRAYKPDVVFSTGGYASFPASLAARLLRRPLVVYLPDTSPGWAVRVEQRLANTIATTTDAALAHLPAKKTTVTGYPVRPAFFEASREEARAALSLEGDVPLLVVAGASQGAKVLNDQIFAHTPELCSAAVVIHATGTAGIDEAQLVREQLPEALRERYIPTAFRDDLPVVMRAADLAIFRAGASVLGELPAACLPSILVPATFAGGHQAANARWLADAGAAVIVEETEIAQLSSCALALLADPGARAGMASAAAGLVRRNAVEAIGDLVVEVVK